MASYYVARTDEVPGLQYTRRQWFREKPRANLPQWFDLDRQINVSNEPNYRAWSTTAISESSDWTNVTNRALLRFTENARNFGTEASSQLGATLGEWRQAHDLILGRAGQLLGVARQLRSGNFSGAARMLGVRKYTKGQASRGTANLWLEWSYGWKPLVEDIYNAVDVLQSPLEHPDGHRVTGRASGTFSWRPSPPPSWSGVWECHVHCQAHVRVWNPNLFLANKLGLVNPASVAWELVPFSFVVDWFIPVGTFLQSFTDFVGLYVDKRFTTKYGVHTYTTDATTNPVQPARVKRRVQVQRRNGLPNYALRPRFTGFYSMRGANAIALLVSQLRSLK